MRELWTYVRIALAPCVRMNSGEFAMKRIKIRFPNRDDSAVMMEVMRRGQVICLRDQTFIVPEPAIDLLTELGASFENLGEVPWDHVVRTLRNSVTPQV